MTKIVTELSPVILKTAVKDNLYAFFHALRQSDKAEVQEKPYGFCWRTNVAHPWFNGILQSSDMGYRVYQRLGFQKMCQMDHFYWQITNAGTNGRIN